VDEIAQGRVWIGSDAFKLGLVDRLGGMSDALDSAAQLAKLEKPYKIKYFRKKPGFWDSVLTQMKSAVFSGEKNESQQQRPLSSITAPVRLLLKQVRQFARFNDPNGVYAIWTDDVDF
jgi:protease-4